MPYTTLVAGTTITASWANANVRDQVITPFASAAARTSAIVSPVEGMGTYLTNNKTFDLYNNSAWISYLYPTEVRIDTSETTVSAVYADLATVGPAVTVTTGTKALVILGGAVFNSGAGASLMGFAVSGATTVAAADPYALWKSGVDAIEASRVMLVSGLTAGSNVFTAKYKATSGTATFLYRTIAVLPLP